MLVFISWHIIIIIIIKLSKLVGNKLFFHVDCCGGDFELVNFNLLWLHIIVVLTNCYGTYCSFLVCLTCMYSHHRKKEKLIFLLKVKTYYVLIILYIMYS